MLRSLWRWNRNTEQRESAIRGKTSFPEDWVENVDLPKLVFNNNDGKRIMRKPQFCSSFKVRQTVLCEL